MCIDLKLSNKTTTQPYAGFDKQPDQENCLFTNIAFYHMLSYVSVPKHLYLYLCTLFFFYRHYTLSTIKRILSLLCLYLLQDFDRAKCKSLFLLPYTGMHSFYWPGKYIKVAISPLLTGFVHTFIVWPQWWSFAAVCQQGFDFSKQISKRKIIFWFDFHRCSQGSSKSA